MLLDKDHINTKEVVSEKFDVIDNTVDECRYLLANADTAIEDIANKLDIRLDRLLSEISDIRAII